MSTELCMSQNKSSFFACLTSLASQLILCEQDANDCNYGHGTSQNASVLTLHVFRVNMVSEHFPMLVGCYDGFSNVTGFTSSLNELNSF